MKKYIFVILLLFVTPIAFSQTIQSIVKKKNCSFAVILRNNEGTYISTILYSPDTQKPQIGFEGGGIWTVANQYEENEKYLFIKIINRWIGLEEDNENEKRKIFIYNCILNKEDLINVLSKEKSKKSNFISHEYHLDKESMYISFVAEDVDGSIFKKQIYTKLDSKLKKEPDNKSQIIKTFSSGVPEIGIKDIVLSKDEQVYLFVEIDGINGYLSFAEIQNKWTIKTNKLQFSFNNQLNVIENLKLRENENLSSNVLVVMAENTKVKIIGIGNEDKIDGIKSNWVKVEVIEGKDNNGKDISPFTTGWCYGGYLK